MNWADTTIIVIILLSAVISLFRGFVREVLSLVAWVAAFWAATMFTPVAAGALTPYVAVAGARTVIGFVGILVGTLLVFGIINFLVGKLIDSTGLSGPDRLLGAVFGLARGAAIIVVLVFLAGLTPVPRSDWWRQAQMIPPFQTLAMIAVNWLPPDLRTHFSY